MYTAFISHPNILRHVMDADHPESPARISAIKDKLIASHLYDHLKILDAPVANDEQLGRVHSVAYIRHVRESAPQAGFVHLDLDTTMVPMTLSAALHAAGAVVLATDLVMTGEAPNAFCCIRPPGHHAGRTSSAGFCIFNNIAVGVAHAISMHGIERAAIIDFDVHHGEGSEDIFRDNPNVMLCSTFQHPFYPGCGADTRSDHMINVPLPAGTNGKDFRAAVEREFAPALEQFKPQILFVSAGFDAHRDDPLASLKLIRDDYIWLTRFIKDVANQYAHGRIISSLEGGYDLISLADSTCAHIRTLADL